MARIRKNKVQEVPAVSTASLPDIIFTLLFFFMVSAKMKDQPPLVQQINPEAIESRKLSKQDLSATIWIGQAMNTSLYDPMIQLDNKLISADEVEEVQAFIRESMLNIPYEFRSEFIVTVKADKNAQTGLVREVLYQAQQGNVYPDWPLRVNLESDEKTYD
ncbi:MAG: biopolymer transporter ExbD [Saprospiraceae bacterium]|nr:biopolymer transporter ExbD [Saprospiraceae bacterium]